MSSKSINDNLDKFLNKQYEISAAGINEANSQLHKIIMECSKAAFRRSNYGKKHQNIKNKRLFDKECHETRNTTGFR